MKKVMEKCDGNCDGEKLRLTNWEMKTKGDTDNCNQEAESD